MPLESINPATESPIARYDEMSPDDVRERLHRADAAQQAWKHVGFDERADRLRALAEVLRDETDTLARLATEEMGKPLTQAKAEVEKCAIGCEYYAEHAEEFLSSRTEHTPAARSYVRYDPLGVILAIMPWNFPFWQVLRCAAPGVMAGNGIVLKHASNVSGVALAIEESFRKAQFPDDLFTTLLLGSERTEALIEEDAIRAVTLTGSERAGRAVAAAAGKHLKPSVLELGGSDPFIVLADADVGAVAASAVKARTQNNGQSCIAAKRFLVEQSIVKEFEEAFVAEMQALTVGDPLDEQTDIGPLAREDLRDTLHEQVTRSCQEGAKRLCGGEPLEQTGWYYPPTVLTNVRPGMAAFDEETFGPVAAVIAVADQEEAVQLANRSAYGLGASIWSGDAAAAEALAPRIDSGSVFINEMVKSNPNLPFGGVKLSGYGRELSREGLREFVNVKTVWVGG